MFITVVTISDFYFVLKQNKNKLTLYGCCCCFFKSNYNSFSFSFFQLVYKVSLVISGNFFIVGKKIFLT